jgi:predicted nucleic acid-binding Zn ribbon protein
MYELDLMDVWEEMMGKAIAKRTRNLRLRNKILTIELDSSVLREELHMGKTDLIRIINEKAGKPIVEDIHFK